MVQQIKHNLNYMKITVLLMTVQGNPDVVTVAYNFTSICFSCMWLQKCV